MLVAELSQSLTLFGLGMGTVFVLLSLLIACITAVSSICRYVLDDVGNCSKERAINIGSSDQVNNDSLTESEVEVKAPFSANVLNISVDKGGYISKGDIVMLLEAMKMETKVRASHSGFLSKVHVDVGDSVDVEQALLTLSITPSEKLDFHSSNKQLDDQVRKKVQTDLSESGEQLIRQLAAPLSANVIDVCVTSEQQVNAGDVVVRLEAMKMETEVRAEFGGYIAIIHVKPGDSVNAGQTLLTLN